MFSQGIPESWGLPNYRKADSHIPCASNIVWIYLVCEHGNISQLKYSWFPQFNWSIHSTCCTSSPEHGSDIFSLFIDEEPCHRTQRICIVKIKTVAYIFCGVRYCSKYITALPLDRAWGACRDGTDTGVTSPSQDPQLLRCEFRGAKSRTLNLFPEMFSSPEESGRKLRVWDNLEHLSLCWKGMYGSLRPAPVSHLTCTTLPSFL